MSASHWVKARNDAEHSENKIHDDDVARQYGFQGGLVPGVAVYGYMTWAPVSTWGLEWLTGGAMSARFAKPVYDGDEVEVRIEPVDGRRMDVAAVSRGEVCGTGSAWLPEEKAQPAFDEQSSHPLPAPDARPPADEQSLAVGTWLGTVDKTWGPSDRAHYLDLLGDDLAVYDERRLVHPGALIRTANEVLARTVRLGPWIHVSSTATNLGTVSDGETVTTRGRVVDLYERKGHRFVELDVVATVADRPVLSIRHTAIYEPRRA
jgi:MaoC like domain